MDINVEDVPSKQKQIYIHDQHFDAFKTSVNEFLSTGDWHILESTYKAFVNPSTSCWSFSVFLERRC